MTAELDVREMAEIAEGLFAAPTPVETAEEVVSYAIEQLDADHGGITLMRRSRRLETLAATDALVEQADALQYELDEGSCRDSSWHGDTLTSEDLASDERWPRWGPKAASLGIASVLASELTRADGRRIGSVNLYWSQHRSFTADDVAFARIFTRHAALALGAAMEVDGLNVALDGRKLIGQAQGILMERHSLDGDRAFEVLKRYSQDHNAKLQQIAEQLVATGKLPSDDGIGAHRRGTAESGQGQ